MTSSYYNWNDILSDFSDFETLKIIKDNYENPEKRKCAKQILLNQNVIKENDTGNYTFELIEPKYLDFTSAVFKSMQKNNIVEELVEMGLEKKSSARLVDYFLKWNNKQKRKLRNWIIVLPISFLIWLTILLLFNISLALIFLIIPAIIVGYYKSRKASFRKEKVFKVLDNQ